MFYLLRVRPGVFYGLVLTLTALSLLVVVGIIRRSPALAWAHSLLTVTRQREASLLLPLRDATVYKIASPSGPRSVPVQVADAEVRFDDAHGEPVSTLEERNRLLRQLLDWLPRYNPLLEIAYGEGFSIHVVRHAETASIGSAGGFFDAGPPPTVVISSENSPRLDEGTVAHELYHAVDSARGTLNEDPEWVRLNPRGSKAYIGYDAWKRSTDTSRPKGFARSYGTTELCEDKATLLEELATNRRMLLARLAGDQVLRAKVALLVRRLPSSLDWVPEVKAALLNPRAFAGPASAASDQTGTGHVLSRECGGVLR